MATGDTNLTNLVLSGNLTVDGTQTITGAQTFTGAATFNGAVALNDTVTVEAADKIQFRDTGLYMNSGADGKLTISADGSGADDITLAGTVTVSDNLTMAATKTINADADKLLVGSKIVPQTFLVSFVVPAGATAGDYDGVIPIPVACKAVTVTERHKTAGSDAGAVTLMVAKVPSATAQGSGTDMLSAGINLKAAADTNQSGTLHGTAANYTFAAGDGVALVTTGTLTAVDGVTVTVEFERV